MPRGDKTGPEGQGPMTGRGLGDCSRQSNDNQQGRGFGRGFGRGNASRGRGLRRLFGFGGRFNSKNDKN